MIEPTLVEQEQSPSSKSTLTTWWRQFKVRQSRAGHKRYNESINSQLYPNASNNSHGDTPSLDQSSIQLDDYIFGVPLEKALSFASGSVGKRKSNGEIASYYSPIPVIVAVCGIYLYTNALSTEGIFRLSGSAKRMKSLQKIFASPPTFGRDIDWTGYTVHDAANILRRYLNNLPEPVIPLEYFDKFRVPFISSKGKSSQSSGYTHSRSNSLSNLNAINGGSMKKKEVIHVMQSLIPKLPQANRQLLLYILDLLDTFSKHSKKTLMPVANLAAIFQPCILSHPDHRMSPDEYKLSQAVVIFLIEHRKNFAASHDEMAKMVSQIDRRKPENEIFTFDERSSDFLPQLLRSKPGRRDSSTMYYALSRNGSQKNRDEKENQGKPSKPVSLKRSKTVPAKRVASTPAGFSDGNVGSHGGLDGDSMASAVQFSRRPASQIFSYHRRSSSNRSNLVAYDMNIKPVDISPIIVQPTGLHYSDSKRTNGSDTPSFSFIDDTDRLDLSSIQHTPEPQQDMSFSQVHELSDVTITPDESSGLLNVKKQRQFSGSDVQLSDDVDSQNLTSQTSVSSAATKNNLQQERLDANGSSAATYNKEGRSSKPTRRVSVKKTLGAFLRGASKPAANGSTVVLNEYSREPLMELDDGMAVDTSITAEPQNIDAGHSEASGSVLHHVIPAVNTSDGNDKAVEKNYLSQDSNKLRKKYPREAYSRSLMDIRNGKASNASKENLNGIGIEDAALAFPITVDDQVQSSSRRNAPKTHYRKDSNMNLKKISETGCRLSGEETNRYELSKPEQSLVSLSVHNQNEMKANVEANVDVSSLDISKNQNRSSRIESNLQDHSSKISVEDVPRRNMPQRQSAPTPHMLTTLRTKKPQKKEARISWFGRRA
ncbi:hypothetical protein V1511DRAFT_508469 [Dipodascopsis uninucleata]